MFSIVLPCYNEQDNLDFLFKEIQNFKSNNFQFILLNNGSSDNTGKRINNFKCNHDIIKIHLKENKGLGFGIKEGLKMATNPYIGYMHVHNFVSLNQLIILEKIIVDNKNPYIFIKGLRYGKRPIKDLIFSYGLNFISSIFLFKKLWEITAQPTIFHRDLLRDKNKIPNDFKIDLYIYYIAILSNFEILKINFSFKKRTVGQSSWNRGLSSQLKICINYLIYLFKLLFTK